MADGSTLFEQMAMGFAPVATMQPPTAMTGFEGMPFHDMLSVAGPMGPMAAQAGLRRLMSGIGYTPMGFSGVNVYDRICNFQHTQAQNTAMMEAAQRDREQMMRTMRGMAAVAGVPWGAEQRRLAGGLADAFTYAAPMLAQARPDLLDQLAGATGSQAVMTQRMFEASRFRMDPVTGRMGLSAESVQAAARGV